MQVNRAKPHISLQWMMGLRGQSLRIPINKIYRAFPELDEYTDQQCQLLVKRVQLSGFSKFTANGAAFGGFIVGLIAMLPMIYALIALLQAVDPIWQSRITEDYRAFIWAFGLFWPAAVGGLIGRDMVLRRLLIKAINVHIDRVRCPQCKYILIGQREHHGAVTCPECGHSATLRSLGLVAADLIPPESAKMPLGREMDREMGDSIPDKDGTLAHLRQHQTDNPVNR
jgi:hypothetical protein